MPNENVRPNKAFCICRWSELSQDHKDRVDRKYDREYVKRTFVVPGTHGGWVPKKFRGYTSCVQSLDKNSHALEIWDGPKTGHHA